MGAFYTWGNIIDYEISYLKYNGNEKISYKIGFFFLPITILMDNCSIFFGARLDRMFGPRT